MAERANARNQLPGNRFPGFVHVAIARLGDVVGSSKSESFQGSGGSMFGERAEHDDGNAGVDLAQLANGFEAVHLGHFNVEEDDVGLEIGELGQSKTSVGGGAGYLEGGIAGDGIGKSPAHNDCVVDDKHSLLGRWLHKSSSVRKVLAVFSSSRRVVWSPGGLGSLRGLRGTNWRKREPHGFLPPWFSANYLPRDRLRV